MFLGDHGIGAVFCSDGENPSQTFHVPSVFLVKSEMSSSFFKNWLCVTAVRAFVNYCWIWIEVLFLYCEGVVAAVLGPSGIVWHRMLLEIESISVQ